MPSHERRRRAAWAAQFPKPTYSDRKRAKKKRYKENRLARLELEKSIFKLEEEEFMPKFDWKVSYRLFKDGKLTQTLESELMEESKVDSFIKGLEAACKIENKILAYSVTQITEVTKKSNTPWLDSLALEHKTRPRFFAVESFLESKRDCKDSWRFSKSESTESSNVCAAIAQVTDFNALFSETPKSFYPEITEAGYRVRDFRNQTTHFVTVALFNDFKENPNKYKFK